mmetsp:Transcript_9009/g.11967  ORF Transcript_9009/g.11967 Transcript_9009/m.11967 type:complete len:164 (+) Transcript_9009:75-566(+)
MAKVKKEEDKDEENVNIILDDDEIKPGQRYPTPTPGEGTRVYYESLFHQNPRSELAQEWCVNYGILEWKLAWKVYKKICERKGITPEKPKRKKEAEEEEESQVAAPHGAWDHAVDAHLKHKKAKKHHHGHKKKHHTKVIGEEVVTDTGLGAGGGFEGAGMTGL